MTTAPELNTQRDLETLVDRIGLNSLVQLLAVVCEEKANHLRANWQDEVSAKAWERSAKALDKITPKMVA